MLVFFTFYAAKWTFLYSYLNAIMISKKMSKKKSRKKMSKNELVTNLYKLSNKMVAYMETI